ncbi:hypothetical protein GCM10022223_62940 [Kineosporia mesophila]|uniref:F5/8 type C domain-containing protein n=1 Tax=Kineosporia mesophila TaxID=566012 RepID=A0ABP7AN58_9ACTN|nr:discoidin domain-containing protein [Kineosporia mesophila]
MDTTDLTPEQAEPDDVMSSGRSPVLRSEGPARKPLGISLTLWSVLAVLAVTVGGVVAVQWATRSSESSTQESALSGIEVTIPYRESPTSSVTSSRPTASARATPSGTPAASPTGTARATTRPSSSRPSTGQAAPPVVATPQAPTKTTATSDDTPTEDETDEPADTPAEDEVAAPGVDLAASAVVRASSQLPGLSAANVTDGSVGTYWESSPGYPQTLTVDLGEVTTVGRLVLSLPERWSERTQTLSVQGSADGSSYTRLKGSASYHFESESPDNQVTITLPQSEIRYLRLTYTAVNGWYAAQLSDLSVHSS